ncbi:MAG TPA: cupredoxin domain-containing protein [Acidimicrobiia bacterium]|nr:cupredoxin domain-containing protein [Acidimicrobiia bacterium]
MDSRAFSQRAFATVAAVVMASTIAFSPPAGADHADHETCRSYAQVPNPFVKIEAEDGKFDTNCLMAPADRDWRIYFMNRDGDAHNISIYSADPAVDKKAEQLYEGKSVKSQQQEEYAIEGLPPGKYYFQDDKAAKTMNGAIEIADKKKK